MNIKVILLVTLLTLTTASCLQENQETSSATDDISAENSVLKDLESIETQFDEQTTAQPEETSDEPEVTEGSSESKGEDATKSEELETSSSEPPKSEEEETTERIHESVTEPTTSEEKLAEETTTAEISEISSESTETTSEASTTGDEMSVETTTASDCSTSEFGCCPDKTTTATGPDGEGCVEQENQPATDDETNASKRNERDSQEAENQEENPETSSDGEEQPVVSAENPEDPKVEESEGEAETTTATDEETTVKSEEPTETSEKPNSEESTEATEEPNPEESTSQEPETSPASEEIQSDAVTETAEPESTSNTASEDETAENQESVTEPTEDSTKDTEQPAASSDGEQAVLENETTAAPESTESENNDAKPEGDSASASENEVNTSDEATGEAAGGAAETDDVQAAPDDNETGDDNEEKPKEETPEETAPEEPAAETKSEDDTEPKVQENDASVEGPENPPEGSEGESSGEEGPVAPTDDSSAENQEPKASEETKVDKEDTTQPLESSAKPEVTEASKGEDAPKSEEQETSSSEPPKQEEPETSSSEPPKKQEETETTTESAEKTSDSDELTEPTISEETTTPETSEAASSSESSDTSETSTEVSVETTIASDCSTSEFRCCPDNTTATGPDGQGCESSITLTNDIECTGEGCCESWKFGCCADNSTRALSADGLGCPCETLAFGCCTDGKTPASGPDHEGCGCATTQFGCCPDNSTAARGPDNEGCPCESLPNGCCPDRLTPSPGANFTGCPCEIMPFGCCPNSTTAATGPFFEGCICVDTPHGCCADGVSVAFGPHFEGCKDGPPLDTRLSAKACALPKERGTCRNYTVKWTYDMSYGGCIRFWFGGCGGNANRYKSQEECERICINPAGSEACLLPKVEGPCEGNYTSFYFNQETGRCEKFSYGGCLGNKNRFDTIEGCEQTCMSQPNSSDPCDQPVISGPCRGAHHKWYYNKNLGRCQTFIYGGCGANGNNFNTEGDCRRTCGSASPRELCILPKAEGPCLGQYPRWFYDYTDGTCKEFTYTGCEGNRNRFIDKSSCEQTCNQTRVTPSTEICSLPQETGPCKAMMVRWSFDQTQRRCKQFLYGGCGGNANKFENRIDCERTCGSTDREQTNVCLLKREVGNCITPYYNFEERWFYDITDQTCHRFHFSGCGGNGNNFRSLEECQTRCGRPFAAPPPTPDSNIPAFSPEHCFMPKDRGPCYKNEVKWFYDSRDGVCKEFYYGGCGGNPNQFYSRKECERKCWNSQDICKLPKIRGPCSGNFVQWYYDATYDSCLPFNYSLCNGNANRFSQKETCEAQCKKSGTRNTVPIIGAGGTTSIPGATQTGVAVATRGRDSSCLLPVEAGDCRAYIPHYYYDSIENICRSFIYTGCGGNSNRFESRIECENRCVSENLDEEPLSPEERDVVCRLAAEPGPCGETQARWYYDPSSFNCLPFVYTGCGGNKNRFKTFEVCQKFCQGVSNLKPEGAISVHIPDEDRREENVRNPLDPFADSRPGTDPSILVPPTYDPIIHEVTSTTPSTTTQKDMCRFECSDSPFFADCELILRGQFCSNPYYAKFCCKACLQNNHIDMEKVKEIIIGENHGNYQAVNEANRICFYENIA